MRRPGLCYLLLPSVACYSAPRRVTVLGGHWVNVSTGEEIVLRGPNIVVKGPPYLPRVQGETVCDDTETATCYTFNAADARHISNTMHWNVIRLSVAWAGAQPTEDVFDRDFFRNLREIILLCARHGIYVILEQHGDMVGSANCGWGVPMWLSQKAAPSLIGRPLRTQLPYSAVSELRFHSDCGDNETAWALFAGDPNYNLLNPCCVGVNSGANNNAVGYTVLAQETMWYLFSEPGRAAFARFWARVAREVADLPNAIGIELMNEPMSIHRKYMFQTWRASYEAIRAEVPDMAVGIMDLGEGAVFPKWVATIAADLDLDRETVEWLKASDGLFYAWHWYGAPTHPEAAVAEVTELRAKWGVASMLTETMSCAAIEAAERANISWSYWHYSRYCDTAPAFGSRRPPQSFGACILGWDGGTSSKRCDGSRDAMSPSWRS